MDTPALHRPLTANILLLSALTLVLLPPTLACQARAEEEKSVQRQIDGMISEIEKGGRPGSEDYTEISRKMTEERTARRAGLKRSDPGTYRKIRRFFDNANSIQSPLLVDEKRVYFIQPDWSLTMVDLESGEARKTRLQVDWNIRLFAVIYPWIDELKVRGVFLVGESRYHGGGFIADKETGIPVAMPGGPVANPIIFRDGSLLYCERGTVTSLDIVTRKTTPIAKVGTDGWFTVDGNILYLLFPNNVSMRASHGRIEARDVGDHRLLWSLASEAGELWLGMAVYDGQLHVFSGREGDRPRPLCREVVAVSPDGKITERWPATPDLFGGAIPDSFKRSYTYRGNQYVFALSKDIVPSVLFESYAAKRRYDGHFGKSPRVDYTVGPLAGGYAWMDTGYFTQSAEDKLQSCRLHFRDDRHSWSGTVNCVDDLMAYARFEEMPLFPFRIGLNDRVVVYATDSGKMECLDRETGRSRWIYVFPRVFYENSPSIGDRYAGFQTEIDWETRSRKTTLPKTYFMDEQSVRDDELSLADVRPFTVDGDPLPPTTRIAVDPGPILAPGELGLIRVLAWLPLPATLAAGAALILAIRRSLRRNPENNRRVAPHAQIFTAMAFANAYMYYMLGGYSRATAVLTVLALLLALLGMIYVLALSRRPSAGA